EKVARRGLGLSTFVSAGNRADVSGNDLLQYWEEDDNTEVVLLYLESIGNPRKFSRVARRLARRKPVLVVKSGRSRRGAPHGHVVRETRAPAAAIDALFRQAGVIRVESIHQLFDIGQLVAHQPLPTGRRVAVLGNSDALSVLAADACDEAGLELIGEPLQLGADASATDFQTALAAVFEDPNVDSVVALFIPPLTTRDEDVAQVLAAAARRGSKTVVSTFLGMRGVPEGLRSPGGLHAVPSYATPEDAVRALAAVTDYAGWRARPAGHSIEPPGLDVVSARALVAATLGEREHVELDQETVTRLLACYGIELWPTVPVTDVTAALEAAERVGFPVALKTLAPHLRHRSDLGGVVLNIANKREMRSAFSGMAARLGPGSADHFVVQRMAPTGVAAVVGSVEDPLFGPVVSFGLGGVATELLGDRTYRIPPLTDVDVRDLVRSVRAAPLLFGHRGAERVDVAALEDLLSRVAHLADDLSEVAELELNPVLVSPSGVSVLAASGRLAQSTARTDRGPRALPW
ncbi:MAG TPA: acetate--CoA ligase family protein, partial [Candidatus Eisenbacteria bacterium]|nr:acetate--CoA ligase family protein [Candidatus Eisenbacteria bacterium]